MVEFGEKERKEERDAIMQMKWGDKTKYGYTKAFNEFAIWLSKKHPEMISEKGDLTEKYRAFALIDFCAARKKKLKNGGEANLSFSGLNRFRSAVSWKMLCAKLRYGEEEAEDLSVFFSGLKKRSAREKQTGERDMEEGKLPMKFEVYKLLAEWFWSQGMLFELLYMVLTWNLCCRTNNTESIRMGHLGWFQDSLEIVFGVTKTNQDGQRREVRLIYANPFCPSICPVLILGLYLANSSVDFSDPSHPLFPGGNQASRFNNSLRTALSSPGFVPILATFGQKPEDLGAHSLRKGAGTYLCSGSTASPSHASVCIRMSWSLGTTQERYLHYNKAADGYCGRILCGLPQTSVLFALLPPHPTSPFDLGITKQSFPSTSSLSRLELVRQFCLSSLLYHFSFISIHLPKNHSFFFTPYFCLSPKLKEIAFLSGTQSLLLSPTGLPPHVLTWVNQQETMSLLKGLPERILSGVGGVLKENGVAAGNITREVLEDVMKKMLETDRDQRKREEEALRGEEKKGEGWAQYMWGGKFHLLPENFLFPTLTVFQCWNMWWNGNREKKTPPFSILESRDVPKSQKSKFSDVKCLMREMMVVVKEKFKFSEEDVKKMSIEQLLGLGKEAGRELGKTVKKQKVRPEDWVIGTALREVRQARTKQFPDKKRKQKAPVRKGERKRRKKAMFGNQE